MRSIVVVAVLVARLATARADEPAAAFQPLRENPHVGVPFVLALAAEGFDETPAPEQPKLDIPGAKVTPLGAQPAMSRMITSINGRQTIATRVQWTFRWRIDVAKPGPVRVPSVTVIQGSKRATAAGGEVNADTIPTTDDMKLELGLPDRPVFVGENVEITLTWLFRRQPEDQTFSLPIASLPDFTVSVPPAADPRRALKIDAGDKQLAAPFEIDDADVGGARYKRVRIHLFAAPRRSGKVDVPPASVVASLAVGRPDIFGNAESRMFRATDVARTLDVKPLPETDRPASFAGAVGTQFAISAHTSRSVVQLGEPVELEITVKSDQRLDTLALGKLDGDGGLPRDKFTVPAEPPTGELADDGKTKTFKITAQVTGPATEIPAIAFAYFDPVKSAYQTVHSDPIALSVKGGTMVGASDVVAAQPTAKASGSASAGDAALALVGADLALSAPDAITDRALGGGVLWILVAALYAIPLILLAFRSWQLRTSAQREEAAEVRAARKRVEHELARAAHAPARDAAGPLAAALRGLARALEREPDDHGLLATIETESFAPTAAASPLSAEVRQRAAALVKTWTHAARRPAKPRAPDATTNATITIAIALAFAAITGAAPTARADTASTPSTPIAGARSTAPAPQTAASIAQTLADGRAAYQDAMTVADATARKTAFARAQAALGAVVQAMPDRPELLTDWGNAALGAGDVAIATLAYRRALALDGTNPRALRNLGWLRSRQGDALRLATATATDTLFFFHTWPRSRRMFVGAIAFALGVLALVPWGGRRRRGLVGLAVLPLLAWIAMVGSLAIEDRHGDDAIVMDSVQLRAADSAGAPAALTQPLPRGTEVTVIERRDAWAKVRLANGTSGWVQDGAVTRVALP